jgi:hypothetical protein
MATSKQASSYRLSPECRDLMNRLADHLGISQASVIEMAVRKLARAELPPDQQPTEPPPGGSKRAPRKK